MRKIFWGIFFVAAVSCGEHREQAARPEGGNRYAEYFRIEGDSILVTISPYSGEEDTLYMASPLSRLICMSTSYIGYLDALGCDSVIVAVSGKQFVTQPRVRTRAVEIGYEAAPDYEAILRLHPDLLLTYAVSSATPQYISKLRSLGIRVFVLHEHLESHPLARAEYVRLFGKLTGRQAQADSVFAEVERNYRAQVQSSVTRKVLINIPYRDAWYIPGAENYMSRLIRDAGGEVLGAKEGARQSAIISVEEAYRLSQEADFWLNPGWCSTLRQLRSVHPLFENFPVLAKGVYNNTLRSTPEGGNDFWESGAIHPDLILEDLVRIFRRSGEERGQSLHYYLEVQ